MSLTIRWVARLQLGHEHLARSLARCLTCRGFGSLCLFSVPPRFVTNWQTIERLAVVLPPRHEAAHQRGEAAVVSWLQQMDHLMHDDVFKAFTWLLCQLCIKPNSPCAVVAASPLRFHPLHKEPFHLDAQ